MTAHEFYRRNRRAVAGGVIAVAVYASILGARTLSAGIDTLEQRAIGERELLARELGLLADSTRLPTRIDAAATALDDAQGRLFDAQDALAAEALLSDYVAEAAAEHIVFIESVESRTSEPPSGSLIAIALAISASSDLQGILGFLADLRSGPKLVRVHEITIETGGRSGGRPGEEEDEQVLRMRATMDAFAAVTEADRAAVDSVGRP